MTETEEQAYLRGQRQVWLNLLQLALRELGLDSPEANEHRWKVEREEAVSMLRQVCALHGDNDWPEDLHLGDIIEKHLWRNLESK